ncbi:MAG TPA: class I SAM-dependent methyltransferase [Bryobacteraceae bacterium]|nr:class I SAM-dependent methyltransferase [Bryobacteraceae bacterium]
MKLTIKPDTLTDRMALLFSLVPLPLIETQLVIVSARAIIVATELGVFSCLYERPCSALEIAKKCQLDPRATEALLGALVSADYLKYRRERFELTSKSRKWLAAQNTWSLFDYMPHVRDVWEMLSGMEGFLRNGVALDIHSGQSGDAWSRYQRAMRSLAALSAAEVVGRLPLATDARRMLDIGGSHGFYAVAFCSKYSQLSATILDLPAAIEHAAPILAGEGMGDRIRHQAGDALADDLGENAYDLILLSNLVHHFTDPQNHDLMARAARALVPGGLLVIQDLIRPHSPNSGDQVAQVLNLFFALTSTSGTWSVAEVQGWLRAAKLSVRRPLWLRSVPGAAQLVGQRRALP